MEKSIIEELYNGNIQPYAKQFGRNTNFGKGAQITADNEEKLNTLLDQTSKELLAELLNAQGDMQSIASKESFIEGFKIGMRMAVEALFDGRKVEFKDITE